jgi:hypothetical protein
MQDMQTSNTRSRLCFSRPARLIGRYLHATTLLIANLALTACPHDIGTLKMNEQLDAYGAALRWNRYEQALDSLAPPLHAHYSLQAFGNVHVTSYNPLRRQAGANGSMLSQKVEIRYFLGNEGAEKSLIDQQTWLLDSDKDKWFLQSGLPNFK